MTKKEANIIMEHLLVADARMRELFSFYWHRRNHGVSEQRMDQLVQEIKNGEKVIQRVKEDV